MSSAHHEFARVRWFGTVMSDGGIVVDRRYPSRFAVNGLWDPNRTGHKLSYTVVAYFPGGWPLKGVLYAAAKQFVVPLNGQVEHGPCAGVPHTFGVVIPIQEPCSGPREMFAWLGHCLFNALLTAVEQASPRTTTSVVRGQPDAEE